jgi:plastocyanin
VIVLLLCIFALALGDVYMHNPRGSNDRLNERGNRQNANRIYDSQDNAAGGYAWGPPMKFYVGSRLEVQWTQQHSCGIGNNNCELVLQYMCDEHLTMQGLDTTATAMRDGTTTNTVPDDETDQADPRFGRQETWKYYQDCKTRNRNTGLFIADRNIGNTAISTRQNNGGTRHGFECTEERDYYPYWHPNPWVDIAVLTSNTSRCDYYKAESFNVLGKGYCDKPQFNSAAQCAQNQGKWLLAQPWNAKNATLYPPPECLAGPVARDNHLGSANQVNGEMANYWWTIPNTPGPHCVLRLRYNISTGEYDGWTTFSNMNAGASPIRQDPTQAYGTGCGASDQVCNLTLALNTNQYGRTFQDRSYMFSIVARPNSVPAGAVIHNLNIRGKRGNIVQTYPAVEYDFAPARPTVLVGEYVHFQWTGSEFHDNNGNNNAEGVDDQDRNNICEIENMSKNRCRPIENITLFDTPYLAIRFAHVGQWDVAGNCLTYAEILAADPNDNNAREQNPKNCQKQNGAPAYFDGGLVQMNKTGDFYYMSSRNNNFSNRSQKGAMLVRPALAPYAQALIGVGAGLAILGAAAMVAKAKGVLPFFGNA